MDNTNWPFLWGGSKGKGRTWEDLEVRVHRVHDVNFPDYQYKYYAKRELRTHLLAGRPHLQ